MTSVSGTHVRRLTRSQAALLKKQDYNYEISTASDTDSDCSDGPLDETPRLWSQWYDVINAKHEVPRKLFHSVTGFFSIWLYVNGYNAAIFTKPFIMVGSFMLVVEVLRFRYQKVNLMVFKLFGFMMRESEHQTYNGTLYFLFGLILTTASLPKDLCLMTNMLLSWADTSASIVGREWGKYTVSLKRGKSLAGSIASFVTGVFVCYLQYAYLIPKYHHLVDSPGEVLWSPESSKLSIHVFAAATGLIASVSEFIDLWGLDDNFTIPTLSGLFLYTLLYSTRL